MLGRERERENERWSSECKYEREAAEGRFDEIRETRRALAGISPPDGGVRLTKIFRFNFLHPYLARRTHLGLKLNTNGGLLPRLFSL